MDHRNHAGSLGVLVGYAPLWAHLSVYAVTCLIVAIFFYSGHRPALALVEYFSGAIVPTEYSLRQAAVLWALLLGAPALLSLGFVAAMRIRLEGVSSLLRRLVGSSDKEIPIWIPFLLFAAAAGVGAHDLTRAGAFARLGAWSDYGAWVEGRWMLFATLGYFSFVNLYLILPVSTTWLILAIPGRGWKVLVMRLVPLAIVGALTLFLFQKKALIVSLILIFGAALLHRVLAGAWTRRLTWLLITTAGLLAMVYFVLVVLPIYSETSRTANEALVEQSGSNDARHKPCEKTDTPEKTRQVCREVVSYIGTERSAHVMSYVLLAPMTRTSLPAMYYPIVFPEHHDYYGLDFGQDILGFGGMPDDNIVIWKHMYPDLPGGSAGAPYQFALYSQVGVIWTLFLCVIVGLALGVMWQAVLTEGISRVWRSLMGAVLVLYGIYLAIDSIRGGLLASYGLIWAWAFIIVSFLIGRLLGSRQQFKPA